MTSHLQSKKTPIYENCTVIGPDGQIMFRCGKKKAQWYVNRGLGHMVSEQPPVYQFDFEPRGWGHLGDDYYTAQKENKCVVCGCEEGESLTRHHVVPYCYRKHFPVALKDHNYHDILPLCVECHMTYERFADKLKLEYGQKYETVATGSFAGRLPVINRKALSAAMALKLYRPQIPVERVEFLFGILRDFCDKKEITDEDIESVIDLNVRMPQDHQCHGCQVVKSLTDIPSFIIEWRKHFVSSMNPQYLPAHWSTDRAIL